MNWTKEPALQGKQQPCLHAGVAEDIFPPDGVVCVGFGCECVTRDGGLVFDGDGKAWDECMTGAQAEVLAAADPDHDWRILLLAPMSEREYQRHDTGRWVLIKQGEGFA